MKKWTERLISWLKYLIAGYMILAGLVTTIATLDPVSGPLGFLYSTRISLVIIGLLILYSGATLMYGKVKRSKKWTGRGLFYVYLCFFFAAILNGFAYDFQASQWVGNAIAALITGALWLRWKFKTEYINPKHFKME